MGNHWLKVQFLGVLFLASAVSLVSAINPEPEIPLTPEPAFAPAAVLLDSEAMAARVDQLRPTTINRVLAEARELEQAGCSLVSLMRGQPDTPTPGPIVEAACRAIRDGRTGYADQQGEPALRQAVATKLARIVWSVARHRYAPRGAPVSVPLGAATAAQHREGFSAYVAR